MKLSDLLYLAAYMLKEYGDREIEEVDIKLLLENDEPFFHIED